MTSPDHRQEYEGSWRWDARARRLEFDVPPRSDFGALRGTWSTDGIAPLLDGFSRRRLLLGLEGDGVSVNCAIGLADGRQIQLVGAFLHDDEAKGMVLSGPGRSTDADHVDTPGPALEPVFQPIISIANGKTVGFEALARWDADLTTITAAQRFEDDGLASNMLIRAAEALSNWKLASQREDLFVHVNLTGRDLEHAGLVGLVEALVEGHGLAPSTLRIELTEQAALRDAAEALKTAQALKACGAGLVLDDFGSGHSSFSWLADLPADGLKIDPDLVRRLGEPRTDAILKAVTTLCHDLGMTVTGEGVEAFWQMDQLKAFGFDYAQGFALGRPLTQAAALDRLSAED
ncbi:MAG: EAL domain-containing protein [Pseudomonadota bacterium]